MALTSVLGKFWLGGLKGGSRGFKQCYIQISFDKQEITLKFSALEGGLLGSRGNRVRKRRSSVIAD